ncbi:hypothetical protein A9X02_01995 [Mycobacterium malmoense]|nr:hypothetical protein A9X02_01995 [Mycobacterium malmoense]
MVLVPYDLDSAFGQIFVEACSLILKTSSFVAKLMFLLDVEFVCFFLLRIVDVVVTRFPVVVGHSAQIVFVAAIEVIDFCLQLRDVLWLALRRWLGRGGGGRGGSIRREDVADACHGRIDFTGDLFIQPDELHGTLADIGGKGLRLSLPGGPSGGRPARRPIGDREVFAHGEARIARVFDRVSHP